MDSKVMTAFSGDSRIRRLTTTAAIALAMAGCVNPAFRESVGTFGTVTKSAVTAQSDQLTRISQAEVNRRRDLIAGRRTDLIFDPESCNRVLLGQDADECMLRARGGDLIRQVPRFGNIVALGSALSAYGDSLVALAADSTADQAAFATSVTSLGTSLSNLNNAIRQASGEPENNLSAPLGAVAKLVGELGNLYFAYQRNRVLRKVIREGAPAVRRAIELLSTAAAAADQSERRLLGRTAIQAQIDAGTVARNPASSVPDIRRAQDLLFDSVDALNRYNSHRRLFQEMAAAHDKLVAAAARGASAEDLRIALDAVIHLATTAHETVTALNNANGSTGNGN